jgi:hypothetical protein
MRSQSAEDSSPKTFLIMIVTFWACIFPLYPFGLEGGAETSVWARRNSTPSGESSANILLELGQHAFAIYCVQMHFEPYVLACLELLEIQLTCLVSGITCRLP